MYATNKHVCIHFTFSGREYYEYLYSVSKHVKNCHITFRLSSDAKHATDLVHTH